MHYVGPGIASVARLETIVDRHRLMNLSTSRMNDFGVSGHNRLRYIPFGCYRENQTI